MNLRLAWLAVAVACAPASMTEPSRLRDAASGTVGDPEALPGAEPGVSTTELGEVDLAHAGVTDGPSDPPVRDVRRMDVDQLNAAVRRATGRAWTKSGVDQFEAFAATLGRPDYNTSVSEDLQPSLLFAKVLGDASRDLCQAIVTESDPGFFLLAAPDDTPDTDVVAVRQNLSTLILKYHGKALDASDPKLDPWLELMSATAALPGKTPRDAWRGVCIALLTHPDFITY